MTPNFFDYVRKIQKAENWSIFAGKQTVRLPPTLREAVRASLLIWLFWTFESYFFSLSQTHKRTAHHYIKKRKRKSNSPSGPVQYKSGRDGNRKLTHPNTQTPEGQLKH